MTNKKWDCDAVIILSSRSQKTALKKISGSDRAAPITVGGQSYDMLQLEGVGLCFCCVSSNSQYKIRIAKLAKLEKYFDYNKIILINPNYTELQVKRAKVGLKDSWYFVEDKQSLIDVLHLKYDDMDDANKKIVDKLIPPPPPSPARPAPGQIVAQDGSSVIVMRNGGAPPFDLLSRADMLFQLWGDGGSSINHFGAPPARRRAPEPQREAQPETKKAKAITKDDMECLCCADNQKDTILNCGHLEMCGECALKVQSCPSCSIAITERKHVWL